MCITKSLCIRLQDNATTGKKGLGQGERALKIEGVKITSRPGQKKVFADIEESDEDETQEAVTSDSQCEVAAGEKLEKKRKRDETSGNGSSLQMGSKIKLKELVAQFLTEVRNLTSLNRLPLFYSSHYFLGKHHYAFLWATCNPK